MMWLSEQVHLMGTVIDLTICHEQPKLILAETVKRLELYEHRFSANSQNSELMAINLKAGKEEVVVHPELFELIKLGKENSLPSDSLLNIAIGPLTKAWRIGFDDAKMPNQEEINQLLKVINPKRIGLNNSKNAVYLEEGMSIDLGALAKGFIADLIKSFWEERNVCAGLINLGGNIVTFGEPPKKDRDRWRIGIRKPTGKRDEYETILKIKNKSVVTSGIYERVLTTEQQEFHHIFDSKTGYPVESDVLSLTIVSDLSVVGEIWTTRLFGKNSEEILANLNEVKEIEGIIITQSKTLFSQGMAQYRK